MLASHCCSCSSERIVKNKKKDQVTYRYLSLGEGGLILLDITLPDSYPLSVVWSMFPLQWLQSSESERTLAPAAVTGRMMSVPRGDKTGDDGSTSTCWLKYWGLCVGRMRPHAGRCCLADIVDPQAMSRISRLAGFSFVLSGCTALSSSSSSRILLAVALLLPRASALMRDSKVPFLLVLEEKDPVRPGCLSLVGTVALIGVLPVLQLVSL